jgi:predicted kinase
MEGHLIHLICGGTGAGKSTYAAHLTANLDAIRFSIDEWMTALFWMDSKTPIEPNWAMERVSRCEDQIWVTALQVARRRIACVLDLGFSDRRQRAKFVGFASDAGLTVALHHLEVPMEERWRRVQARNDQRGETYQLTFDVTREMFEFMENIWETPSSDELRGCDQLKVITA